MNFGEFFSEQAKQWPDRIALRVPIRHWGKLTYRDWTFGQLLSLEQKICYFFKKKGLLAGQRFVLALPMGPLCIASIFALLRLRVIPLLIDPGQSLVNLKSILAQGQPDGIVTHGRGWVMSLFLHHYFPEKLNRILLNTSVLGEISLASEHSVAQDCHPKGEAIAILYTSGSTGAPKGVVYTDRMLMDQLKALGEDYALHGGTIDYPVLPIFTLFNPLLGITTVLPEVKARAPLSSSMRKIWEGMEVASPTQSFASPIFWKKLTDYAFKEGLQNHSLKKIFMAGCSMPEQLFLFLQKVFPNASIQAPYGATEALPLTDAPGDKLYAEMLAKDYVGTPLGVPLRGVEMRIVFEGTLKKLPIGEIGEIVVSGQRVSEAYDGLDQMNAQTKLLDENGKLFHRMGDLGYEDREGNFWFCGRLAERVISYERTWYPDICERIFLQHPSLERVALIAYAEHERVRPALVVQMKKDLHFGWGEIVKELKSLAATSSHTEGIEIFFKVKKLPVDRRHNAKIHRLELAKKFRFFNRIRAGCSDEAA